ncbi:MAG: Lcl C-terminal domain-containing protein [bacterium]
MKILKKRIQIAILLFAQVTLVQAAQSNLASKLIPVISMILSETSTNVKKTGQTKSYNENGSLVNNGSVKDDGYYKKGITRNFSRDDAKQIVTDHVTGLMWQDDSGPLSVQKPWLTQTNYDICIGSNGQSSDVNKCVDTSGDTAATYCSNLALGGYMDWRLPTSQELEGILYYGGTSTFSDPSFSNFASVNYISSTTYASNSAGAWRVYFAYGTTSSYLKSDSNYVRCVRGSSAHVANTTKDDSKQIVTDYTTRLQWQDDADAKNITKKWKGAIEYCDALSLGGYTDWRLPNINELKTIVDRAVSPSIVTGFTNSYNDYYWSSTSLRISPHYAFVVNFGNGVVNFYNKNSNIYSRVRCVRDNN